MRAECESLSSRAFRGGFRPDRRAEELTAGRVSGSVATTMDLLPTIATLCGAPLPSAAHGWSEYLAGFIGTTGGRRAPHFPVFRQLEYAMCADGRLEAARLPIQQFCLESGSGRREDQPASIQSGALQSRARIPTKVTMSRRIIPISSPRSRRAFRDVAHVPRSSDDHLECHHEPAIF